MSSVVLSIPFVTSLGIDRHRPASWPSRDEFLSIVRRFYAWLSKKESSSDYWQRAANDATWSISLLS